MSEFREMRRKRQQLSEEESIAILQKATAGTLALLGDNDYPYAVPISYVYADGRLYFHSALSGIKSMPYESVTRLRSVSSNRITNSVRYAVSDSGDMRSLVFQVFLRLQS